MTPPDTATSRNEDGPYVVQEGDPTCEHPDVHLYSYTTNPAIKQWLCPKCGRIVEQREKPTKVVMPDPMTTPTGEPHPVYGRLEEIIRLSETGAPVAESGWPSTEEPLG